MVDVVSNARTGLTSQRSKLSGRSSSTPRKFGTDLTQSRIGNRSAGAESQTANPVTRKLSLGITQAFSPSQTNVQLTRKQHESSRRNLEKDGSLSRAESASDSSISSTRGAFKLVTPAARAGSTQSKDELKTSEMQLIEAARTGSSRKLDSGRRSSASRRKVQNQPANEYSIDFESGPLGMQLEPVVKSTVKEIGCRVVKFVEVGGHSQAKSSNKIRVGDIIVCIDGSPVLSKSYSEIIALLKRKFIHDGGGVQRERRTRITFRNIEAPSNRTGISLRSISQLSTVVNKNPRHDNLASRLTTATPGAPFIYENVSPMSSGDKDKNSAPHSPAIDTSVAICNSSPQVSLSSISTKYFLPDKSPKQNMDTKEQSTSLVGMEVGNRKPSSYATTDHKGKLVKRQETSSSRNLTISTCHEIFDFSNEFSPSNVARLVSGKLSKCLSPISTLNNSHVFVKDLAPLTKTLKKVIQSSFATTESALAVAASMPAATKNASEQIAEALIGHSKKEFENAIALKHVLLTELSQARAALGGEQEKCGVVREEVNKLKRDLVAMDKEATAATRTLTVREKTLSNQVSLFRIRFVEQTITSLSLQDQVSVLKDLVELQEGKLSDLEKQVTDQSVSVTTLTTSMAQKGDELACVRLALKNEKEGKESQLIEESNRALQNENALRKAVISAEDLDVNLANTMMQLLQALDTARKAELEKGSLECDLTDVRDDLSAAMDRIVESERQMKKSQQTSENLRNELERSKKQFVENKELLDFNLKTIVSQREEMARHIGQIDQLQKDNDRLLQEKVVQSKELYELNDTLLQTKNRSTEKESYLTKQITELEKNVTNAELEYNNRISIDAERITELEEVVRFKKKNVDNLRTEASSNSCKYQLLVERLEQTVRDREASEETLRATLCATQDDFNSFKADAEHQKISSVESLSRSQNLVVQLEDEGKSVRKKNEMLEMRIETVTAEWNIARSEANSEQKLAQDLSQSLQSKIADLQEKAAQVTSDSDAKEHQAQIREAKLRSQLSSTALDLELCIADRQACLTEKESKIKELMFSFELLKEAGQVERSEKDAKIDSLELSVQNLNAEIFQKSESEQKERVEISRLLDDLSRHHGVEMETLEKNHVEVAAELTALIAQNQCQCEDLKLKLRDCSRQASDDLRSRDEILTVLQEEKDTSERKLSVLIQEMAITKQMLADGQSSLSTLKFQTHSFEGERRKQQEELSQRDKQILAFSSQIILLEDGLRSKNEDFERVWECKTRLEVDICTSRCQISTMEQSLNSMKHDHVEELKTVTAKWTEMDKLVQQQQDQLAVAQKEIASEQEKVRLSAADVATLKSDLSRTQDEVNAGKSNINRDRKNHVEEMTRLKRRTAQQLHVEADRRMKAEQELGSHVKNLDALRDERKLQEKVLEEDVGRIKREAEELIKSQKEEIFALFSSTEKERRKLNQHIEKVESEKVELQMDLALKSSEVVELRDAVRKEIDWSTELSLKLACNEKKVNHLAEKVHTAQTAKSKIDLDARKREAHVVTVTNLFNAVKAQLVEADRKRKEDHAQIMLQLQASENESSSLSKALTTANENIHKYRLVIEQLEFDSDAQLSKIESLTFNVKDLNIHAAKMQKRYHEQEQKLADAKDAKQEACTHWKERIIMLEAQINDANANILTLRSQNAALEKQHDQNEKGNAEETQKFQDKIGELSTLVTGYESKINNLQNEIEEFRQKSRQTSVLLLKNEEIRGAAEEQLLEARKQMKSMSSSRSSVEERLHRSLLSMCELENMIEIRGLEHLQKRSELQDALEKSESKLIKTTKVNEKQINDLNEMVSALDKRLIGVLSESDLLVCQVDKLRAQNIAFEKLNNESFRKLESSRSEMNILKDELELAEVGKHQQQIEYQDEISKQKNLVEVLDNKLKEAAEKAITLQSSFDALDRENKQKNVFLEESGRKLFEVEKKCRRLEEFEREHRHFSNLVEALRSDLSSSTKQLLSADQRILEIKRDLTEKDRIILELQSNIEDLLYESETQVMALNMKESYITELETKLSENEKELTYATDRVMAAKNSGTLPKKGVEAMDTKIEMRVTRICELQDIEQIIDDVEKQNRGIDQDGDSALGADKSRANLMSNHATLKKVFGAEPRNHSNNDLVATHLELLRELNKMKEAIVDVITPCKQKDLAKNEGVPVDCPADTSIDFQFDLLTMEIEEKNKLLLQMSLKLDHLVDELSAAKDLLDEKATTLQEMETAFQTARSERHNLKATVQSMQRYASSSKDTVSAEIRRRREAEEELEDLREQLIAIAERNDGSLLAQTQQDARVALEEALLWKKRFIGNDEQWSIKLDTSKKLARSVFLIFTGLVAKQRSQDISKASTFGRWQAMACCSKEANDIGEQLLYERQRNAKLIRIHTHEICTQERKIIDLQDVVSQLEMTDPNRFSNHETRKHVTADEEKKDDVDNDSVVQNSPESIEPLDLEREAHDNSNHSEQSHQRTERHRTGSSTSESLTSSRYHVHNERLQSILEVGDGPGDLD